MATIEPRRNKAGEITSYRITVAGGLDSTGKQVRHRMTWRPEPKMTARQTEKALARAAADFERQIEQGFQIDHKQTFEAYAAYVLDLKERTGIKPYTIDRYRSLLVRINAGIGHLKLSDIRPQHLNNFYKNLSEQGVRSDGDKATARLDITAWCKAHRISKAELARRSHIADATITAAAQGKPVRKDKAQRISDAMGMVFTDVFDVRHNADPLSDRTILDHHRLISSILSQAEKEMLIPYNPASKATPPKHKKNTPDYYQPEQMMAIIDALEDVPLKWKALTYFLIDTGCRRGEVAGLKWESIDLDSNTVTIERALLYNATRGTYEGTTKTGKIRAVKLAPETVALLKQHRAMQLRQRMSNGDRWHETGYVFTQENGLPMNPTSITGWLNKFSKKNQLPHIHPHAFRHTAASMMIADGVDLVTTAHELGHANATTTANIYAHVVEESRAKAAEVRSKVFAHCRKEKASTG